MNPEAPQPRPSPARSQERRKRNRPALSCVQCRARKIRCDRNEPCASCVRSKIVNCMFEEARRPKPRLWNLSPGPAGGPPQDGSTDRQAQQQQAIGGNHPSAAGLSMFPSLPVLSGRTSETASALTPATHLSGETGSPASLAERVRQLEEQLSEAMRGQSLSSDRPRFVSESKSPDFEGLMAKTRYFGRSHWINVTKYFPMIVGMADRLEKDKNAEYYQDIVKCKNLARSIKSQRVPTRFCGEFGKNIPPEGTALELVSAYLRTFETVCRIVHVPTFWQEYRRYWENPRSVSQAFIILFQLCMAIGTCFQDNVVALRAMACQWIYEAQFWLVLPSQKSRLSLPGLQIMCLLHLARGACGVGGDLTWISAGSLMRTAMYMGFHRDPDNLTNLTKMSVYRAEMRRRLWASILEIVLQSSMDSGGPPLISVADFDTKPPSNFDDEQLSEDDQSTSVPRPSNSFTQTTVQIALLRSFPTRLAIVQYVNSFRPVPSYDETLRWNSELSTVCRTLAAVLQPAYDPAGVLPRRLSLFQLKMTEHMVHRCFLALNNQWLPLAQHNPAYYFARKMCVETSLKLYRDVATPPLASASGSGAAGNPADDFKRLALTGAGTFRSIPLQATMTLALELLWQAQEDRSFRQSMNLDQQLNQAGSTVEADLNSSAGVGSGAAPRAELLEAVRFGVEYWERRVRVGETNVKGYIFLSALMVQMETLLRGANDAEVERATYKRVGESLAHSWELLKEIAGEQTTPVGLGETTAANTAGEPGDASLGNLGDMTPGFGMDNGWDWDDDTYEGLDFNFNFGYVDPIGSG